MVCSLETRASWDKNNLASGTVSRSHLRAKDCKRWLQNESRCLESGAEWEERARLKHAAGGDCDTWAARFNSEISARLPVTTLNTTLSDHNGANLEQSRAQSRKTMPAVKDMLPWLSSDYLISKQLPPSHERQQNSSLEKEARGRNLVMIIFMLITQRQAFYILIILKNELFQPFNIYIVEYQPNKNQLHQDLPLSADGNSIMSNERCYK